MESNISVSGYLIICLSFFLLVGGLIGGLSMVTHPDGSGLGMSVDLLRHAPVNDFRLPGVFLLTAMAVWPAVNISAIIKGAHWASKSVIILGCLTMTWIVYQYLTIRVFSLFQPAIFVIGLTLAICGLRLHCKESVYRVRGSL